MPKKVEKLPSPFVDTPFDKLPTLTYWKGTVLSIGGALPSWRQPYPFTGKIAFQRGYVHVHTWMDIAATALRSGYNYLASQAAVLETAALLLSMKLFRS